jgi:uncharacterized protein YeaO (DUF488 family)
MAVSVVRLGSPRAADEGLRIGTVRRPPRGVPRAQFASGDWYDTWLPELSPSAELLVRGQAVTTDREWDAFVRAYRREMAQAAPRHLIELLASLSHTSDFAVGCYCEDERRCHRSVLRELLGDAGARLR